ncbi:MULTISPECIES: FadR/GntR family transcriptional regulator [Alphaproteobacteria]|uniref:GntR family transcriptional regulator n=2 Tax=Alphaproteobacteria TaxID=28211 RepID=A0A512HL69_9HYPH|nr:MULTISPECIES: FadR/GntR family transcriptional regulator [Alphaproteobacteria]GEO86191.1 GntR family transcriptional regulator [Ciceribacter naphthalenivorans]GLR21431.1 GntR family transcriptional regulator [Ciceribacter naphthalenivorans]GLT04287.1 GntR family transcriptional regulator [Sphingomonas psychrolutea]
MSEPGSLIRARSGRSAAANFHSFIINEIGAGIVSGRFPVGSILPRDAELMDMYGVSRTVLREALKTLEAKGLVEARPKVGTRVSPKSRWALFDHQVLLWHFEAGPEPLFVGKLFDVRRLLECETVRLAAKLRTADHIRMLYYWLQQMSVSRGMADSFALATLELHRVLAEASQNPLLRAALGVTEFTLAAAMPEAERQDGEGFYETAVVNRRNLVQAVEAGDVAAAEACLLAAIGADLDSAQTRIRAASSPDIR